MAAILASVSLTALAQGDLAGAAAVRAAGNDAGVEKAVSTQSLGARSTVTPSATSFGGFFIDAVADVYILVRGNSLGTLGITQGFLDAPRVRLYTSAGQDIVTDSLGRAGFNLCVTGSAFTTPVVNYYANVRLAPVHGRDACVALRLQAGGYSFSVTPSIPGVTTDSGTSIPSSGEVLFEVTFSP